MFRRTAGALLGLVAVGLAEVQLREAQKARERSMAARERSMAARYLIPPRGRFVGKPASHVIGPTWGGKARRVKAGKLAHLPRATG